MRSTLYAAAMSAAVLSSRTDAQVQCEWTPKDGVPPTVFIAQQGREMDEDLEMFGFLRTDAFLIGGSVYCAGTPTDDYSLGDFLTRTQSQLTHAMNNFILARYPDTCVQAYDDTTGEWFYYVPEEDFNGLVIMDIEGHGLVVHPDNLLDHYRYTSYEGLTRHALVNRIMAQYGKCADITRRGFPGSRIGLFGVLRGRRNGSSSEEFVRKAAFFKQKAAHPNNWLRNVDYLCPVVFSGWSPNDEITSCTGGTPIRSCSTRYAGMIDTALGALTRGPLIDRSGSCRGNANNPESGCANVNPSLWVDSEPVVDAEGRVFRICPLLSVKILNGGSCDDGRYLVEDGVDPTLENTLGVISGYLNEYVFEDETCVVDCYAYWVDQQIDRQYVRRTMERLAYPVFGDFNDNGKVGFMDDRIFTNHWLAGRPRADMNGDGVVNADDRCIMNGLLSTPCP